MSLTCICIEVGIKKLDRRRHSAFNGSILCNVYFFSRLTLVRLLSPPGGWGGAEVFPFCLFFSFASTWASVLPPDSRKAFYR